MAKAERDLPVIAFKSQRAWEAWLASQPADSKGLWLKLAKKSSGIASVSKQEAIDTALRHGWIDGQLDAFDDAFWLIRFTPRQSASKWSEKNRVRALELVKLKRMQPAGLREIDRAKRTAAGMPPMRRRARPRCLTISALRFRRTREQKASSRRSTAPTVSRSFTGSTAPRSRKPGRRGSRSSSRCWPRGRRFIRQRPENRPNRPAFGGRRCRLVSVIQREGGQKNPFISLSF
jgi:hypothetical protein